MNFAEPIPYDRTRGYASEYLFHGTINVDAFVRAQPFEITRNGGGAPRKKLRAEAHTIRVEKRDEISHDNKRKSDCLMKFCRRVTVACSYRLVRQRSSSSYLSSSVVVAVVCRALSDDSSCRERERENERQRIRREWERERAVCSEFNLWAFLLERELESGEEDGFLFNGRLVSRTRRWKRLDDEEKREDDFE